MVNNRRLTHISPPQPNQKDRMKNTKHTLLTLTTMLTAAAVAALTVYDMAKAMDRGMEITDVRLESKSGGCSGDYSRSGPRDGRG